MLRDWGCQILEALGLIWKYLMYELIIIKVTLLFLFCKVLKCSIHKILLGWFNVSYNQPDFNLPLFFMEIKCEHEKSSGSNCEASAVLRNIHFQ